MGRARLSLVLALVVLLATVLPSGMAFAAEHQPVRADHVATTAPARACVYHVVRYGETLARIARWYGVSVWEIAYLNRLPNINRIWPGMRLLIVPCAAPPPAPPPPSPPPPGPPPPPIPSCQIMPVLGFGKVWTNFTAVRAALGCPTTTEQPLRLKIQRYQFGWVWYNYAFNRWELLNTRAKTWYIYQSEAAALAAAAAMHLGAPVTGFFEASGTYQVYAGGTMIWTPATDIVVFYNNGTYNAFYGL